VTRINPKDKRKNPKSIYEITDSIGHPLISEAEKKYETDLRQRLLNYAVDTLKLLMNLPHKREFDVIRYQLSKSATSVGANYEEAQSSSEKEFVQKLRIALREANESKYWYKIIDNLEINKTDDIKKLLQESNEISLILGSIVSKLSKKLNK
jgi:four helix bundle protein